MDKETEHNLIRQAQAGCQKSLDRIIRQYLPLIGQFSRKYRYMQTLDKEDVFQQCCLHAIEAVHKFDCNRDLKFGTYLIPQMRQVSRYVIYNDTTIRMPSEYEAQIKAGKIERTDFASLDAPYRTSDDQQVSTYADHLVFEEEYDIMQDVGKDKLYSALEKLPDDEQEVLMMRYLYNSTKEQMRSSLKIGRIALDNRLQIAELNLRKLL